MIKQVVSAEFKVRLEDDSEHIIRYKVTGPASIAQTTSADALYSWGGVDVEANFTAYDIEVIPVQRTKDYLSNINADKDIRLEKDSAKELEKSVLEHAEPLRPWGYEDKEEPDGILFSW